MGQRHFGFAAAYAFLAGSCLAAGAAVGPWGILAGWPALSFFALALAYSGLGPAVFLKRADGSHPVAARVIHGPYRLTARVVHAITCRIARRSVIGSVGGLQLTAWPGPSNQNAAVLDLCAEFERQRTFTHYCSVPLLDLVSPSSRALTQCMRSIQDLATQTNGQLPVVVHCALGRWRSAIVAAAWLIYSQQVATVSDAISQVRRHCPGVFLSHRQIAALTAWHHSVK